MLLRFIRGFARIRSFHDLPLWAKTLLAPAACLTASVAVIASIWLGSSATEVRLAEVANVALPTASASAVLLDQIDKIYVMAMRALVWQQAGVAQATVDALGADVSHDLDALRASTAAMAASEREGQADLAKFRQIATQSAAYAKMLGEALDLVSDPAIAVGYFRRADATFEALRGDIAGLSAAHRAAEAASIAAARGSSHAALVRSYLDLRRVRAGHDRAAAVGGDGDLPPGAGADPDDERPCCRRHERRGGRAGASRRAWRHGQGGAGVQGAYGARQSACSGKGGGASARRGGEAPRAAGNGGKDRG